MALSKCVTEIKRRKLHIAPCLLILYTIAVGASIEMSLNIALGYVTMPEQSSCYAPIPVAIETALYLVPTLQFTLTAFAYPILGWIGDTKIGRGKAIELSIWSCWLGTLLQVSSHCIQYGTCGLPANIAKYGLSSVAMVFLIIGTGGALANTLAYGLDQLVNKSSAQIRAYVHWTVWGLFTGFSNDYIAFSNSIVYDASLLLTTGLVTFTYISFVLCLDAWFRYKFKPSYPLKINPYKMVYDVVKYAKQHKSPVNRSAFTYCEDKTPSRIDFGKRKYGGPFSETDVENVKTFFYIALVLLSTFGLYIPYYTTLSGAFSYIDKLQGASDNNGYSSYALWTIFEKLIILAVPLYELVIIPLFPKVEYFLLNSLKGLGVSYILMLLAIVSMLIIDTIGSVLYNADCAFTDRSTTESYNISIFIYVIPLTFSGFLVIFNSIASFEFICSQSPSNMSGMVTGVFWFIRATYMNIGGILVNPFHVEGLTVSKLTCTFWNLLVQIMICVVGGVVFQYTVKRYQWRKRDEEFFSQSKVEDVYDRALSHAQDAQDQYKELETRFVLKVETI